MEKVTHNCEICNVNSRRYQCPKCNVMYCSVNCYRSESHSTCSEEFYKECIRDELRAGQQVVGDSQRSMRELLKSFYYKSQSDDSFDVDILKDSGDDDTVILDSDDDSEDEDEVDLAERVKGIDLNGCDISNVLWSVLTKCERLQFEDLVSSGDVNSVLPPFMAWWDTREMPNSEPTMPKFTMPITPFCELSKSPPASCVCNNVANVLAAYAFTVRLYNGDHAETFSDATATMVTVSKNLSSSENFPNFDSAIQSAVLEITGCEFLKGCVGDTEILSHDVIRMFRGPTDNCVIVNCYVLLALNDIYNVFSTCVKGLPKTQSIDVNGASEGEFSKRFKDSSICKSSYSPSNKQIRELLKKIKYYVSWAQCHYTKPIGV